MAYSTAILGATLFIALLSVYNADKWQSNAAGAFHAYYLSVYFSYVFISVIVVMWQAYRNHFYS